MKSRAAAPTAPAQIPGHRITIAAARSRTRAAIGVMAAALLLAALAAMATRALAPERGTAPLGTPVLVMGASPILESPPRIGLNLGHWTAWGAEQLSRNILKNPGFEGTIDRALIRATDVHRHGFSDDEAWLSRADGFWVGADFEVLTGAAAGQRGRILDSMAHNARGKPEYRIAQPVIGLAAGDIVALTLIRDDLPPARWWLPDTSTNTVRINPDRVRPDSLGLRSLGLHPPVGSPVRVSSHLDSIGERAGNLLSVQGTWRLGLWVHGAEPGATESDDAELRVRFHRHGSEPFIDLHHRVEPGWQYLEQCFEANDDGPVGPLEFSLEVRGGVVHIDDVWLGPVARNVDRESRGALAEKTFNPHLIHLLEALRPGYLRDWQGQLGDTLDNRLAPPEARRTTRYRPGDSDYGYGLPEFLDLNHLVGARPWLILPTTFSPDEARRLGTWLAEHIGIYGFEEVVVEFGNENWNTLFRPAGIQDPEHHGAAADRLFAALRQGAGEHPAIRTAINAQYVNPWAALRVARASREADILALAPYFLYRLDVHDIGRERSLLFAGDGGHMAEILASRPAHQELAVYEINLHTTRGDMPRPERDAVVTSTEAGAALAQNLLQHLNRGVQRQNVYRATGYDAFLDDRSDLTQLFGIARNLAEEPNLRTTGSALEALNRVIVGNLHPITVPESLQSVLTASAFRSERGWHLALVSASAQPQTLELHFPDDGAALPMRMRILGTPESEQHRSSRIGERKIELTVPPYSLVTLKPSTLGPRPTPPPSAEAVSHLRDKARPEQR